MRLIHYTFLAGLLVCGPFASTNAQVTVDKEDFLGFFAQGASTILEFDTLLKAYDIGAPGGDNVWDFSEAVADDSITQVGGLPEDSPFIEDFPEADYLLMGQEDVEESTGESYMYLTYSNDTLITLGIGILLEEPVEDITGAKITYTPSQVSMAFPVNYEDNWSYEGEQAYSLLSGNNALPLYMSQLTENTTVDAYGTLIMPDGSSKQALRVTTESLEVGEFSGIEFSNYSKNFFFITKEGSYVVVNVQGEDDTPIPGSGIVENASLEWTYGTGGSTGLFNMPDQIGELSFKVLYPNPAKESIRLEYDLADNIALDLRVLDMHGRVMKTLFSGYQVAGPHWQAFPTEDLAPGQYFVQFRSASGISSKPFIVLR